MTLLSPPVDLTGPLVVELREIDEVAAIVGARVRVREPHGATKTYPGDVRDPGAYVAFVVLVGLSSVIRRRTPVVDVDVAVRCYGRTSEEARDLFNAVVYGMQDRGPRLRGDGIGIYGSSVTGGVDDTDPKTSQPVVTGVIHLIASAQAVTT